MSNTLQKGLLALVVIVAVLFITAILVRQDSSPSDAPNTATSSTATSTQEDSPTDTPENNNTQESMDTPHETNTNTPPSTASIDRAIVVSGTDKFEPIPENEILSGGPGKDGIPSIDNPAFVSVKDADFLDDDDIGMGVVVGNDARFYPFQVLVWHEIVNDTIGGIPLAVTYCPLCRTGVTYERKVRGEVVEFGVSGLLWKSNLLMYNRTDNPADESLWSQVLGRAVRGPHTGERLAIYSSDTVKYGDWRKKHANTTVLSRDTGHFRLYGTDPYGSYYTNRDVSFGATFTDTRLHPKEYVLGVEIDGQFKAYVQDALPVGTTTDTFAGDTITLTKENSGAVRMSIGGEPVPYIGGFWFSWVEVHPTTELFN